MSKRQKAALVSALTMLLLLVPLSVYLFSPVDPVGGVTADTAAGNDNNGSRPIDALRLCLMKYSARKAILMTRYLKTVLRLIQAVDPAIILSQKRSNLVPQREIQKRLHRERQFNLNRFRIFIRLRFKRQQFHRFVRACSEL